MTEKEHDINRLPKWAAKEILSLRGRVAKLEEALGKPEDATAIYDPYGQVPIPLSGGDRDRVEYPIGVRESILISRVPFKQRSLEFYTSGGPVTLEARASNVFWLHVGDPVAEARARSKNTGADS